MPNRIVVGMQWGDEGKGKVVDLLSREADIIARYQGGANAGHTVVIGSEKFILHLIPSGILHPGKICVIGNGVVVDLEQLVTEIDELEKRQIGVSGRLFISGAAHLVLPYHKALEQSQESHQREKIGTTGRGIGPAYTDKFARLGIRVIDLWDEKRLAAKFTENLAWKRPLIEATNGKFDWNEKKLVDLACGYRDRIKPLVTDTSLYLHNAIKAGKNVLFEGAQGTLLDVDFGTYPFATSSNTIAGGAMTGLGVGPRCVDEIIGVMKAYTTRVGNGPFPTELTDAVGQKLQKRGNEFGATTGRPRRCGWLDILALKYAVRVNGITKIALMKLDVLDGLPELKICIAYKFHGEQLKELPVDLAALGDCEPVYETYPGWSGVTSGVTVYGKLPEPARRYVEKIQKLLGVPMLLVSTSDRREETIWLQAS